jgi:hypothetical protein
MGGAAFCSREENTTVVIGANSLGARLLKNFAAWRRLRFRLRLRLR